MLLSVVPHRGMLGQRCPDRDAGDLADLLATFSDVAPAQSVGETACSRLVHIVCCGVLTVLSRISSRNISTKLPLVLKMFTMVAKCPQKVQTISVFL